MVHTYRQAIIMHTWIAVLLISCTQTTPPPTAVIELPTLQPTPPLLSLTSELPALPSPEPSPQPDYWPAQDWRTSTPEQQGLDSQQLLKMLDLIQSQDVNIHDLLVIRHGYQVLSATWYPSPPGGARRMFSVTKSVVSALTGIAIEAGYLHDVQQRVLDFFPDRTIARRDARKEAITIEHLLSMTSGLDWSPNIDPRSGANLTEIEMTKSPDWVQFTLDRSMADAPGTRWLYNDGGVHLLSAILEKATGASLLDFARQRLFGPLGIREVTWTTDPQGIDRGENGLKLTARDLAKFGYLYLHNGQWNGQSVVPAAWVQTSIAQHASRAGRNGAGYGYLWWRNPFGGYAAMGYGGQAVYVLPEQDMVVVFTSELKNEDGSMPDNLVQYFLIPAAQPAPLPDNPTAAAQLATHLETVGQPSLQPIPPPPALAQAVSGQTYVLDNNDLQWQSFTLHFEEAQAHIEVDIAGTHNDQPIGLDGVYRFYTTPDGQTAAMRGQWQDEHTFVIDDQLIGTVGRVSLSFSFQPGEVEVWWAPYVTGYKSRLHGQIQKATPTTTPCSNDSCGLPTPTRTRTPTVGLTPVKGVVTGSVQIAGGRCCVGGRLVAQFRSRFNSQPLARLAR